MQLKLNIGSYCALLWSIFGEQCDYYRKLLKIYKILDREECFTIRDAYTKEICARIMWAIVDNGCSFFQAQPCGIQFHSGDKVTILSVALGINHRCGAQCPPDPMHNLPRGVVDSYTKPIGTRRRGISRKRGISNTKATRWPPADKLAKSSPRHYTCPLREAITRRA
jgi:hypothetical protein